MIVRVFRARIRDGKVTDFQELVREQSIPLLEQSDGMMGYFPGKPLSESSSHVGRAIDPPRPTAAREFVMVTLWRDLDAVRAFAGDHWQQPIVTDDERPLVEKMTAEHYEWFDVKPIDDRTPAPS